MGRGNESLIVKSGSHDQDGRHAHIWLKTLKNHLLQNRQVGFHKTWYVAFGKVQVGKDQEKAQSEKDPTPKTEVGKNQSNNQVLVP